MTIEQVKQALSDGKRVCWRYDHIRAIGVLTLGGRDCVELFNEKSLYIESVYGVNLKGLYINENAGS